MSVYTPRGLLPFAGKLGLALAIGLVVWGSGPVAARERSPQQSLGPIQRISLASNGAQGDNESFFPEVSGDGSIVAFASAASNLVANDTNGVEDIFVYEVQSGQVQRVSLSSQGAQANGASLDAAISADGRYVAFVSAATNLVISDTNQMSDTFVHDCLTGETTRVSVASDGTQGDDASFGDAPSLSADGRYVAFGSYASNLVPEGDSNGNANPDVYVHDRVTHETRRASVSSQGIQGNSWSWKSSISADGRLVAFGSWSTNLVGNDANGSIDIFVHDLQTGQTELVSVDTLGNQGNANSQLPSLSAEGRYVAFESGASNLVAGDTNEKDDIFLHDLHTGQTSRVSLAFDQSQGNDVSVHVDISRDGRFVFFDSAASNLVPGDTNEQIDLFLYDRLLETVQRASTSSAGVQGNDSSRGPSISANGCAVAFESTATNLVPGDTNGYKDAFQRTVACPRVYFPLIRH